MRCQSCSADNRDSAKFCDKCGATLHDYNWFSPMKFCSKCGAEIDPKPPVDGDLLE